MKKFTMLLVIAVCTLTATVDGRAKRPMTPADLYRLKTVSDPRFSPDGRWIAYTVSVPDLEENHFDSDIWLMPSDGGEAFQLTNSPAADHSPRWAPDGTRIAFISGRDDGEDLYIIPIGGGEARRITASEHDLRAPVWMPDGTGLVCGARVLPEGKTDIENWTEEELPRCEARTIDRLLFRQWNRWLGDERNHLFLVDLETGAMRDLTPGDIDVPPVSLAGPHDFDVSPDGAVICYVANTDSMPAVSTNHDLFTADVATLEERRITTNPALDGRPCYSPDGRSIAYPAMEKVGYESDRRCLVIYDRKKEKRTRLTDALDRSVREIVWAPDNRSIFFTARDEGRCSIYRVALNGEIERLSNEGYSTGLDISPDGGTLVFVRSYNHLPAEIYTMPASGGTATPRTALNADVVAELDLPPLEEFWFTGAAGTRVHGFIQRPPGFESGRTYPLVLAIHGGPQGMWADAFMTTWFTFQLVCSPGYVGVFINPRGSAGYGSPFREEVSRDYGGRCYEDLMNGLAYAIEEYDFIDGDRSAAIGGSFGGYSVNWIMGRTDRFDCIVSHAGLYNLTSFYGATEELWFPAWDMGTTPWEEPELYERWSPHRFAQNFTTPTLVTHGERDYRVPLAESLQLFTALRRQGVPARLVVFPDEGHVIGRPQNNIRWWREIHRWLGRYLGNG